mgnify:CR=1 FL=1
MRSEHRQRFLSSLKKVAAPAPKRERSYPEALFDSVQRAMPGSFEAVPGVGNRPGRIEFVPDPNTSVDPDMVHRLLSTMGVTPAHMDAYSAGVGSSTREAQLTGLQDAFNAGGLEGAKSYYTENIHPAVEIGRSNIQLDRDTRAKFDPPPPSPPTPQGPSMAGVVGTTALSLGLLKGMDVAGNKLMDWWDERKKTQRNEESFETIMASHPKFKGIEGDEAVRLRALHNIITDYSPKLRDHPAMLGDTIYQFSQFDQFDPSMLKTLTEPERNLGSKDRKSILEDPAIAAMEKFKGIYENSQTALTQQMAKQ